MINLSTLPARLQNFNTSRNSGWVDGFPRMDTPNLGGVVVGSSNIGNGTLTVLGVDSGAAYGVYAVTVSQIDSSICYVTVNDPEGNTIGYGAAGAPFYAGGLTLLLSVGTTPYAIGDVFAVTTISKPINVTGVRFSLLAYRAPSASSIALSGDTTSIDSPATLVAGGAQGTLSTRFSRTTMNKLTPGSYPYNVLASDPANPDYPVVVFYGTINHDVIIRASDSDAQ